MMRAFDPSQPPFPSFGIEGRKSAGKKSGKRKRLARKGDTSCRAEVVGYDNVDAMDDITKDRGDALARKFGALCNKLFTSH